MTYSKTLIKLTAAVNRICITIILNKFQISIKMKT